MIAHDRIRLIGPVYKMQTPALLRGCLLLFERQQIKEGKTCLAARGALLICCLCLFYLADAAGAGKLFLHLRLVVALIGEELRVIHLWETGEALLIFLFRNCFVRRETVDVVGAREEGETADDIPVLLYPIHDAYPFVFAHRDCRRRIVVRVIELDLLPVLELVERREVVFETSFFEWSGALTGNSRTNVFASSTDCPTSG